LPRAPDKKLKAVLLFIVCISAATVIFFCH